MAIQHIGRHRQAVRRVGSSHVRSAIDRAQSLTLQALAHPLGAHALALLAQLLHDARAPVAAPAVPVDGSHLGVQGLVGQRLGTGRTHAPLAVPAAGNRQHPAQPADRVLVAILFDPGVLHRDPFAKYAVAFRRISTSSFASASSLRNRLHSASSSLTGRRIGRAEALAVSSGTSRPAAARRRLPVAQCRYRHTQPACRFMRPDRFGQPCCLSLKLVRVLPLGHCSVLHLNSPYR